MKRILVAALALAAWASSGPVEAKGCLKGAAVGGVAGHMAGHGALGAAAGCVVGRHRANNQAKQQPNNQAPAQQPPRWRAGLQPKLPVQFGWFAPSWFKLNPQSAFLNHSDAGSLWA